MHLSVVLVVLAVLCVSLGDAGVVLSTSGGALVADFYRGGAKGTKGGTRRSPLGVENSKKGGGKRTSQKTGKGKRSKASSFRTRLEKFAKHGQYVYRDVYRRAKVLKSSAFEAMLLKATWPSNDPVQPDILGEIIKYSIPAFKYSDADGEDDPYYMTLHKLWTKMSETDWRTAVKSLYILHTIARDSQPADCAKFSTAMKDMVKTRNPKNPEHRYFSVGAIAELDEAGAPYAEFVTAYASYVLQRNKLFTARFEELKVLNNSSTAKKALAALKKAQQLITLGLKAEVADKKLANAITGYAAKQTGSDLRDLYALMGEKIKPFVAQNGKYVDQQAVGSADVLALLKFYQSAGDSVKGYLSRNAKLYNRLRIKFPADVDSKNAPSAEAVAQRIRELSAPGSGAASSLSGGSAAGPTTASHHRSKATTPVSRQHSAAEAPRGGAATKRVLQRADRPLTPEEARLSVELAGKRAYAMAFGATEASRTGTEWVGANLVEQVASSQLRGAVEKTSGGAYSEEGTDDMEADDEDDYDDQDDEDEEQEEGEDEEVDEEEDGGCGGCDDDHCGVEDGPQDVKEGARRAEQATGKADEEEGDEQNGEEDGESDDADENSDDDETDAAGGGDHAEGEEEGEEDEGAEDEDDSEDGEDNGNGEEEEGGGDEEDDSDEDHDQEDDDE